MKIKLVIFFIIYFNANLFAQTRQAFISAGDKSLEEGDYYTAGTFFRQALEFNEEDADVLFKIAESSRLYNDYDGAASFYEKYLSSKIKDKNPLATFYLAEMKKYLGLYETAKIHFQNYSVKPSSDSNYFYLKSKQEIISCDSAIRLKKDSLNVDVKNAGNTINTIYSDFAAQELADSVIFFSSQRFMEVAKDKGKKTSYVSKILKSKSMNGEQQAPEIIDRLFNVPGFLNCNSSISSDYKVMIFSRCVPLTVSSYHADLYVSKLENGKWLSPAKLGKEINNKSYNTTQPCIVVNGANGYVLYFSSDRPGGFGGMDLWKSTYANGQFSVPENLGAKINTPGNEITPFYDHIQAELYFSSDWHCGLGGYDIFKSRIINNEILFPVNMGFPVNSSCNDIYFTLNQNGKQGTITSNRPGSMYLHSQTCCYDIYRFVFSEPKNTENLDSVLLHDSIQFRETVKRKTDSLHLSALLPLKLFFDNDQPGRRSQDTIVKVTYTETYFAYMSNQESYINVFKAKKNNNDSMQSAVRSFFINEVQSSYLNLEKFTTALVDQLSSGRKILLTIQGTASPLAEAEYNRKLSKRRISSLLNYFNKFQDGVLQGFIKSNSFVIFEDAAGESLAGKGVSDNYRDKKRSVYHPDACMERRIEAVSIKYID